MPITIIRDPAQAPIAPLSGLVIGVIGYGNQGRAHALNLRDSGLQVVIGQRKGSAGESRARDDGFEPRSIEEAAAAADLVILGLPDEAQPDVYLQSIADRLKPGAVVGFIHGFNIRFGLIKPATGTGVVMVAPKGPGTALRDRFVRGQGLPCLVAVHQPSSRLDADAVALAWAAAIGGARAGVIRTSFQDETDTDLFGEQAVLCGGMTWLILAAFETLVQAGYDPELAYLECCHEVKQIADLVHERGIAAMMQRISNTAEFGAHVVGPAMIDESVRQHMAQTLARIRDGSFARAMRDDFQQGFPWFNQQRERLAKHPIEQAGRAMRSLMPWLGDGRTSPAPLAPPIPLAPDPRTPPPAPEAPRR